MTDPSPAYSPIENLTLDHYRRLSVVSGLSDEIIRVRGYRSIAATPEAKSDYMARGFRSIASALPGIEIPVWTVRGPTAKVIFRADTPIGLEGHKLRYLTPPNTGIEVDVHPALHERITGSETLIITEGTIKADSAVSRGLVCVSLPGVWAWRGSNEHGGKTALADWETINLSRTVYIAFDSDVTSKPQVRLALKRLEQFLKSRGATVAIIQLPALPNGEKCGLDDYFVNGGSTEGLAEYVLAEGEELAVEGLVARDVIYEYTSAGISKITSTGEGKIRAQQLTSIHVEVEKIIRDVESDTTSTTRYLVTGRDVLSGRILPSVEIDALSDIPSLVDGSGTNVWAGNGCYVSTMRGVGGELSNAVRDRMTLFPPETATKYRHTGWARINDKPYYLTKFGAVGAEGITRDVWIDLGPGVEVSITEIGTAADARQSLELYKDGDQNILSPISVMPYMAVLRDFFPALGFSMHIVGSTGQFKTEIAKVAAAHFGREGIENNAALGSWSSTANALMKMATVMKDSLMIVDDLVPSSMSRNEYVQKTDLVFRSIGNMATKARLTKNITMREQAPPRTLVISTGEDTPIGESLIARLMIVNVYPDWISSSELQKLQSRAKAGVYERALGLFMVWVAQNWDDIATIVTSSLAKPYDTSQSEMHRRVPHTMRFFKTTLDVMRLYAMNNAILSEAEADEMVRVGVAAFLKSANVTNEQSSGMSVSERALLAVRSSLERGRGHLSDSVTDEFVPGLELLGWGWQRDAYVPRGEALGYYKKIDGVRTMLISLEALTDNLNTQNLGNGQFQKMAVKAAILARPYLIHPAHRAAAVATGEVPRISVRGRIRRYLPIDMDRAFNETTDTSDLEAIYNRSPAF